MPDSDIWTQPDSMLAVYALDRILKDRGAEIAVVRLTPDAQVNRRGLDYYRIRHYRPVIRLYRATGSRLGSLDGRLFLPCTGDGTYGLGLRAQGF